LILPATPDIKVIKKELLQDTRVLKYRQCQGVEQKQEFQQDGQKIVMLILVGLLSYSYQHYSIGGFMLSGSMFCALLAMNLSLFCSSSESFTPIGDFHL